jgi:cell division protein FtsB
VLFFDSNSLWQIFMLKQRIREIEQEKAYYEQEIENVKELIDELNSNPARLEKFAREQYRFKRKGEDIFVIEETEK